MQMINAFLSQVVEPESRYFLEGFWIDKYEVTNSEYSEFIKAKSAQLKALEAKVSPRTVSS